MRGEHVLRGGFEKVSGMGLWSRFVALCYSRRSFYGGNWFLDGHAMRDGGYIGGVYRYRLAAYGFRSHLHILVRGLPNIEIGMIKAPPARVYSFCPSRT